MAPDVGLRTDSDYSSESIGKCCGVSCNHRELTGPRGSRSAFAAVDATPIAVRREAELSKAKRRLATPRRGLLLACHCQ